MAETQTLNLSIKVKMCSIQELGEILRRKSECDLIKEFNPHSKRIADSNFTIESARQLLDIAKLLQPKEPARVTLTAEVPKSFKYFDPETKAIVQRLGAIKYDRVEVDVNDITPPLGYLRGFLSRVSDKWRGLS